MLAVIGDQVADPLRRHDLRVDVDTKRNQRLLRIAALRKFDHRTDDPLHGKRRRWAVSTAHFPSGKLFVGMT
jgi:hypothetical protein